MSSDERAESEDRSSSEPVRGKDAPAEPSDSSIFRTETTISVDQQVGQSSQTTGIAIDRIEGAVTIQMLGPEPGLDVEDLRRPAIPTKRFEPETILIPRGRFLMGSMPGPGIPEHETEQHEVDLADFRISRYPVTVAQYRAFLNDPKVHWNAPRGRLDRGPPTTGDVNHPVTGVSWHDAIAYCAWLSEQTNRCYALPSEAEWEKAASWAQSGGTQESVEKRRYPWGSEWQDARCTANTDQTAPVTAHPEGASAYGVEDLLGNVQEWTRSMWGRLTGKPDFGYPYDPEDGREATDPDKLSLQARLVVRGGSFRSAPDELSCTARGKALSFSKVPWRGFRVVIRIG